MPGKRKILIIDDEELFRKIFSEDLVYCGYTCKSADTPSEGIRLLKTEKFDLVLLDILMEPLDGWDTLDLIGNLTQGYETPVIMVSSKKMDLLEVVRYGERLFGFMRKPLTREEICAGVFSFFEWYQSLLDIVSKNRRTNVPEDEIMQWFDLSRQIRVIIDLKEEAALRCLPDAYRTEEECMIQLTTQVEDMVQEKRKLLYELEQKNPVLRTSGKK